MPSGNSDSYISPTSKHRTLLVDKRGRPLLQSNTLGRLSISWKDALTQQLGAKEKGIIVEEVSIYEGVKARSVTEEYPIPSVLAVYGSKVLNAFNGKSQTRFAPYLLKLLHGNVCAYCGAEGVPLSGPATHGVVLEVEHVIPVCQLIAAGRLPEHYRHSKPSYANTLYWDWKNLVPACTDCNRQKADKTPQEAGMPLIFPPFEAAPLFSEVLHTYASRVHVPEDWKSFLLAA